MVRIPSMGRKMIEALKEAYAADHRFAHSQDILDYLAAQFLMPPSSFTRRQVSEWCRQARYERNHARQVVTNPVRKYGYERLPNPKPDKREATMKVLLQQDATRLSHRLLQLEAAVAQPDRTVAEVEVRTMLEVAADLVSKAAKR